MFTTFPARTAMSQLLGETLASLDLPDDPAVFSLDEARQSIFQWLAVLESAHIAELEGLTDDMRTLAALLDDPHTPGLPSLSAALNRVGMSLERVAWLGRPAGLADGLLALGRRLVQLSGRIG